MSHQNTVLLLILFACLSYGIQTSLYFPGFDSQPLSADFVSTDSEGHTIWAVHVTQGAAGESGFIGVMTAEGASHTPVDYTFTQGAMTLNQACGNDGRICTATAANGAVTIGTDAAVSQPPTDLGTTPQTVSGTTLPASLPTSAKSAVVSSSASPSRTNAATSSPVTNSNFASPGKSKIGLKVYLSLLTFFSLYVGL